MCQIIDKSTIHPIKHHHPDRPDRLKTSHLTAFFRAETGHFIKKNPHIPLGYARMGKESVVSVALVSAVDLLGQVIGDSIVGGRHGFVTFLPIHWTNFTIFFEVL